jgi:tRNA(fMet)-specific endonuclease VapC
LAIDERVIVRASAIYAALYQSGKLILDADLLIAATAIEHGLVLATNNVSHFSRIAGLAIDNWLA